jgi:YidC/Oxa1 family membrane protein insertase
MEWRAILAVVLSIFVLVIWQYVFVPVREPPQPPATIEPQEKPAADSETRVQTPSTTRPSQPSAPGAGDVTVAQAPAAQSLNERLHVANFSPSAWQLMVTAQQPRGVVRFEYQDPTGWRAVKTFELHYGSYAMDVGVTLEKPGGGPAPAGAVAAEPERLVTLENDVLRIVMTTQGARIKELFLKQYGAPWNTAPNFVWRWDYLWGGSKTNLSAPMSDANNARVNLVEASEAGLWPALEISTDGQHGLLRWGPGLHTDLDTNGSYASPMTFINGERWLQTPKPGQPPLERSGQVQWTAVQNKYYTIAAIPRTTTEWSVLHQGSNALEYAVALGWPLSGPSTEVQFTIYTGPKELRRLAALDANGKSLAELVYYNYGWVRVLRPDIWLLRPLQWLYGVTHNYGIAIIIITVVIKMIFYPLSVKSFKSMQAMQQLQPQMKRLQDMYKNDRQKLNEEMMRLYRDQKVNPMGGCLPMVVQIPVFIALYQVLYTSIELRHAGFIWWIKDLSAPDHPMAIVMGASMVIQQWMTPTTGDPRQAKMMLFMPIIFTFMFLNFPVGLVIYWLVNNLLTIAQQYVMLRRHRPTTQSAGSAAVRSASGKGG